MYANPECWPLEVLCGRMRQHRRVWWVPHKVVPVLHPRRQWPALLHVLVVAAPVRILIFEFTLKGPNVRPKQGLCCRAH